MLRLQALPILTLLLGLFLSANHKITQHQTAAYPDQLPGAFTGGFGEESCHSCHFDYPLNPESGSLSVEGIPSIYEAGKTYALTISVEREKLGQAGFQISSRFEDGSQAGSFDAISDNLQFTDVKGKVQYLQHSLKGSKVHNQSAVEWDIKWTAPALPAQQIIFHIAANAGNGDASAFGDFIFLKKIEMQNEPD